MVTVQEATRIILENCYTPKPVSVPITEAVGHVLSEKIIADRDFPPFDRVSMDGIAIRYDQWKNGRKEFIIEELQAAGQSVKSLRDEEHCIEVMTGAVLPQLTDTVIRYEDLRIEGDRAFVTTNAVQLAQNVHRQGGDARKKDVLVPPGSIISPAEVALLATIGQSHVDVLSLPQTAIVASGDELVEIETDPEPHQIRRSNTYAIQAAMKMMNWPGTQFHLPDHKDFLKESLATIIAGNDVIILSGGVSKGKFDYVPEVLEDIGIKKLFHQVSQRPGKPFWFGVSNKGKVVFALPGNPVSTFMCFHRFVKPWLMDSLGVSQTPLKAILAVDFTFEPKLTYFLQVQVINEEGKLMAYPNSGGGSGDFANLKAVDAFLELPLEKTIFKAGEAYPLIPFR